MSFDWDAPDTRLPEMQVPAPGTAEQLLRSVLDLCATVFHLFAR